ncbi:MAG: AraC family transcriptional regulator [Bryobacterales bacterium]|nr:AraC family transcriptional regulator [Bryobacterales bacterium]
MLFVSRNPGPPLNSYVDCVWLCLDDARPMALERILPTGAPQLIINLAEDRTRTYRHGPSGFVCDESPGTVLTGAATRFQIIDTAEQRHVAGIAFRPGGTLPFLSHPAPELTDADTPLGALAGEGEARRLRQQLLEAASPGMVLDILQAWLLAAWTARTLHPAVSHSLARFRERPAVERVADVAAMAGLSSEGFSRRFRAEVGMTPKRFCRLLRFQQAVSSAHRGLSAANGDQAWATLALDCGYFDQAHLIHDFREFSGITPSEYRSAVTRFHNHVDFLQSPQILLP